MSCTHALRKRCPCCKKERKFREPDGNHGGEYHQRRPEWDKRNGKWVCGWCLHGNPKDSQAVRKLRAERLLTFEAST